MFLTPKIDMLKYFKLKEFYVVLRSCGNGNKCTSQSQNYDNTPQKLFGI